MNIFWGLKILRIFLGGHHKIGLGVRSYFFAFYGPFLRSTKRMEDLFGVAKISNIFLGCLKFLIFFVNGRCRAQAYI